MSLFGRAARVLRGLGRGGRSPWLDAARLLEPGRRRLETLSSLGYRVPFADHAARHRFFSAELGEELETVFGLRSDFELTEYLEGFAADYARRVGAPYAVGVSSGTSALTFALLGAGLREGDEVLVTGCSYVATGLAVRDAGAVPVFVDVAPGTPHLDPALLARLRTPRTRAVLTAHLFGGMADPAPLQAFCAAQGLPLVEDACQAHGVSWEGRAAGSFGTAAAFSFNFTKLLAGPGNGGLLVTRSRELFDAARALRDPESESPLLARGRRTPSYLDAVQAAFVGAQLRGLDRLLAHGRRLSDAYRARLKGLPVAALDHPAGTRPSGYAFVVRAPRRDELRAFLKDAGIEARVPLRGPLPALAGLGAGRAGASLPETERLCREALSLPIGVHLDEGAVDEAVRAVARFYGA